MMHAVAQSIDAGNPHRELLGLLEIFAPECQIATVPRRPDLTITTYLDAVADRLGHGFRQTLHPGQPLPRHFLPEHEGREKMARDVTFLVEAYCDLLGCPAVGLRLEVSHGAMCPRFHVDHTGIRLVCTYRGPATEWIEENCADRSRLGPASAGIPDHLSGVIRDASGIHQVTPFAITLLKGSRWQGNNGRGIIHRSPEFTQSQGARVLLALDSLW